MAVNKNILLFVIICVISAIYALPAKDKSCDCGKYPFISVYLHLWLKKYRLKIQPR